MSVNTFMCHHSRNKVKISADEDVRYIRDHSNRKEQICRERQTDGRYRNGSIHQHCACSIHGITSKATLRASPWRFFCKCETFLTVTAVNGMKIWISKSSEVPVQEQLTTQLI